MSRGAVRCVALRRGGRRRCFLRPFRVLGLLLLCSSASGGGVDSLSQSSFPRLESTSVGGVEGSGGGRGRERTFERVIDCQQPLLPLPRISSVIHRRTTGGKITTILYTNMRSLSLSLSLSQAHTHTRRKKRKTPMASASAEKKRNATARRRRNDIHAKRDAAKIQPFVRASLRLTVLSLLSFSKAGRKHGRDSSIERIFSQNRIRFQFCWNHRSIFREITPDSRIFFSSASRSAPGTTVNVLPNKSSRRKSHRSMKSL